MRNISFSMTAPQFIAGTKDVTRRIGWIHVTAGEQLQAIEKGQGLKKGEKIKTLGLIRLANVRFERLDEMITMRAYGMIECRREGFPHMAPEEFVEFFCNGHRRCRPGTVITRLEFVKEPANG